MEFEYQFISTQLSEMGELENAGEYVDSEDEDELQLRMAYYEVRVSYLKIFKEFLFF